MFPHHRLLLLCLLAPKKTTHDLYHITNLNTNYIPKMRNDCIFNPFGQVSISPISLSGFPEDDGSVRGRHLVLNHKIINVHVTLMSQYIKSQGSSLHPGVDIQYAAAPLITDCDLCSHSNIIKAKLDAEAALTMERVKHVKLN